MLVIFEKMALLVIILALGYICAKTKLVGPEFNIIELYEEGEA